MTFSSAASVACKRLISARGEAITYRRGSDESDGLKGIPGQDEFTNNQSDGLTTKERSRDFLIKATDLIVDVDVIEPEPGDEIDWLGREFEVCSPGGAEPAWRYEGHADYFVRVHTREI